MLRQRAPLRLLFLLLSFLLLGGGGGGYGPLLLVLAQQCGSSTVLPGSPSEKAIAVQLVTPRCHDDICLSVECAFSHSFPVPPPEPIGYDGYDGYEEEEEGGIGLEEEGAVGGELFEMAWAVNTAVVVSASDASLSSATRPSVTVHPGVTGTPLTDGIDAFPSLTMAGNEAIVLILHDGRAALVDSNTLLPVETGVIEFDGSAADITVTMESTSSSGDGGYADGADGVTVRMYRAVCGDGIVDFPEVCDEGNGPGILEDVGFVGENRRKRGDILGPQLGPGLGGLGRGLCDNNCMTIAEGASCPPEGGACSSFSCGDGKVQPEFGEECDAGEMNSDDGVGEVDPEYPGEKFVRKRELGMDGGNCDTNCRIAPQCMEERPSIVNHFFAAWLHTGPPYVGVPVCEFSLGTYLGYQFAGFMFDAGPETGTLPIAFDLDVQFVHMRGTDDPSSGGVADRVELYYPDTDTTVLLTEGSTIVTPHVVVPVGTGLAHIPPVIRVSWKSAIAPPSKTYRGFAATINWPKPTIESVSSIPIGGGVITITGTNLFPTELSDIVFLRDTQSLGSYGAPGEGNGNGFQSSTHDGYFLCDENHVTFVSSTELHCDLTARETALPGGGGFGVAFPSFMRTEHLSRYTFAAAVPKALAYYNFDVQMQMSSRGSGILLDLVGGHHGLLTPSVGVLESDYRPAPSYAYYAYVQTVFDLYQIRTPSVFGTQFEGDPMADGLLNFFYMFGDEARPAIGFPYSTRNLENLRARSAKQQEPGADAFVSPDPAHFKRLKEAFEAHKAAVVAGADARATKALNRRIRRGDGDGDGDGESLADLYYGCATYTCLQFVEQADYEGGRVPWTISVVNDWDIGSEVHQTGFTIAAFVALSGQVTEEDELFVFCKGALDMESEGAYYDDDMRTVCLSVDAHTKRVRFVLTTAQAGDAGGVGVLESATPLTVGRLTHVAVAYDNEWMRIFIDGRLDTYVAHGGAGLERDSDKPDGGWPISIMSMYGGDAFYDLIDNGGREYTPLQRKTRTRAGDFRFAPFLGRLDDLRVFGESLTASQVKDVMPAHSGFGAQFSFQPPSVVSITPSTVDLASLDGDAITLIVDATEFPSSTSGRTYTANPGLWVTAGQWACGISEINEHTPEGDGDPFVPGSGTIECGADPGPDTFQCGHHSIRVFSHTLSSEPNANSTLIVTDASCGCMPAELAIAGIVAGASFDENTALGNITIFAIDAATLCDTVVVDDVLIELVAVSGGNNAVLMGRTRVRLVDGIAVVSTLRIGGPGFNPGSFQLRISSPLLAPVLSPIFSVGTTVSEVRFVQQPVGNVLMDEPLATQPSIEVLDDAGNRVAAPVDVVLSVSQGTGILSSFGGVTADGLLQIDDLSIGGSPFSPGSFRLTASVQVGASSLSVKSHQFSVFGIVTGVAFTVQPPLGPSLSLLPLSPPPVLTLVTSDGHAVRSGPQATLSVLVSIDGGPTGANPAVAHQAVSVAQSGVVVLDSLAIADAGLLTGTYTLRAQVAAVDGAQTTSASFDLIARRLDYSASNAPTTLVLDDAPFIVHDFVQVTEYANVGVGGVPIVMPVSGSNIFGNTTSLTVDAPRDSATGLGLFGTLRIPQPIVLGMATFEVVFVYDDGATIDAGIPLAMTVVPYPPPSVDSISSALVGQLGGEVVTISGSRFGRSGVADVTVALIDAVTSVSQSCSDLVWVSESELTCELPAGFESGSELDLAITTIHGTVTVEKAMLVNPAPSITDVSVATLFAANPLSTPGLGNAVTLTGLRFGTSPGDLLDLSLAGVPCASTGWIDNTTVTCVPGAPSSLTNATSGPISILFSGYGRLESHAVTYVVPEIVSVSPTTMAIDGDDSVTISGKFFGTSSSSLLHVSLAGVNLTNQTTWANDSIVVSPGLVSLDISSGPIEIAIADVGSTAFGTFHFLYGHPRIDTVDPAVVEIGGGERVVVMGDFFGPRPSYLQNVTLGGHECVTWGWESAQSLYCEVPMYRGSYYDTVLAITTDASVAEFPLHYVDVAALFEDDDANDSPTTNDGDPVAFVNRAPVIFGIRYSSSDDRVIVITGRHLGTSASDLATILVGSESCTKLNWVSSSYVECRVPSGLGERKVSVATASGGLSSPSKAARVVLKSRKPLVADCFPRIGNQDGGTVLTLVGDGFAASAASEFGVRVGDVPCLATTWIDEQTVTCLTSGAGNATSNATWPVSVDFYDVSVDASFCSFRYVPEDQLCVPSCPLGADCAASGGTNVCQCRDGWRGAACEERVFQLEMLTGGLERSADGLPVIAELGASLQFEARTIDALDDDVTVILTVADGDASQVSFDPVQATIPRGRAGSVKFTVSAQYDGVRDGSHNLVIRPVLLTTNAEVVALPKPPRTDILVKDAAPLVLSVQPETVPVLGDNITLTCQHLDPGIYVSLNGETDVLVLSRTTVSSAGRGRATDALTEEVVVMLARQSEGYHSIQVENLGGDETELEDALYYTSSCLRKGYYGPTCAPCPEGGICPGGDRVWAQSGYWTENELSGDVAPCEYDFRCPGGTDAVCADGYQGELCATCADGYAETSGGLCEVCPSQGGLVGFIIADIVMWTAFGLGAALIKDRELFTYTVVAVRAMQMIGAIGETASARTPAGLRGVYDFLKLFAGDWTFLKTECNGKLPFITQFYWMVGHSAFIMMPMFVLLALVRFVRLRRARNEVHQVVQDMRHFYTDRFVRCGIVALIILYFLIGTRSFEVIMCSRFGETIRMRGERDVVCFQGQHVVITLIALMFIVCHILGLPVALFVWFRKNKDKLVTDNRFMERYNFVYEQMRVGWHNFFLADFAILFGQVTAKALFASVPVMQNIIVSAAFAFKLACVIIFGPYTLQSDNWLQGLISLAALFFTNFNYLVSLGILDTLREISPVLAGALIFVVLAMILVALGYIGILVVREAKEAKRIKEEAERAEELRAEREAKKDIGGLEASWGSDDGAESWSIDDIKVHAHDAWSSNDGFDDAWASSDARSLGQGFDDESLPPADDAWASSRSASEDFDEQSLRQADAWASSDARSVAEDVWADESDDVQSARP